MRGRLALFQTTWDFRDVRARPPRTLESEAEKSAVSRESRRGPYGGDDAPLSTGLHRPCGSGPAWYRGALA